MELSQSFSDCIPVMIILEEIKSKGIKMTSDFSKIYCKEFEDHSDALESAHMPKLWPQTKNILVIYHHFRSYMRDKGIYSPLIFTLNQICGYDHQAVCHWKIFRNVKWESD